MLEKHCLVAYVLAEVMAIDADMGLQEIWA